MRYILCFFLFGISSLIHAQDTTGKPPCFTPKDCTKNLVTALLQNTGGADVSDIDYSYANPNGVGSSYHDVVYKGDKLNGGSCAPAPKPTSDDCSVDPKALRYHVYYPNKGIDYTKCSLPVIIYFHGGGFLDCKGTYLSPDIATICTEFAKRGFIGISVEYRLGAKLVPDPNYTVQQMLAIYRAAQDARGAIRSIIQRQNEGNEPYSIDVKNIFVGGNSAGSVAAMTAAYYQSPGTLASALPSNISDTNVLRAVEQNYYYGLKTINYRIKGVLDLWGGVALPAAYSPSEGTSNPPESFFFKTGNIPPPPTIAFCGAKDETFVPTGEALQFPTGPLYASYRSENYCLADQSGSTSYLVTASGAYGNILGSQNIYEMLQQQHVYSEFYEDCQMGHGLDDDCSGCGAGIGYNYDVSNNCVRCFNSEFGTGATNTTDVNLYIVQRACVFFQNVMNNKAYNAFTINKFVECVNNRHNCNDNPATYSCPISTCTQ